MRGTLAISIALLATACAFESHGAPRDDGAYSLDPADAPECPFRGDLAYDATDPYPYCQRTEGMAFLDFCPPGPTTWGASFWHAERRESRYCDGGDCNACMCSIDCDVDADCPAPTSGTADASCLWPGGYCFLTCDNGELCPEGMYCVNHLEYEHFVCAWISHGDRCEPTGAGWG